MASTIFDGSAGAGINAISGLWQNRQNLKMMREQMAWQTKEREASQAYQTGEREAAQKWNSSERVAQNKYGEDMYNKYQSPIALSKQYKDAGLNPILAAGSAGSGAIGSASGSNVGMSQGGAPQSHGVAPPYQNVGVYADMISKAVGNLKTLGEAQKLGIDVKYYEQQIKNNIKSQELQLIAQDFINSFNKQYLPAKAQAEIDNLMKDLEAKDVNIAHVKQTIDNLQSQKVLTDIEGQNLYEKIVSEINKNKSETLRNEAEANLKDKQAITEGYKPSVLKSEISRNYASAAVDRARIDENSILGKYQVAVTRYNNALSDLSEIQSDIARATKDGDIKAKQYYNDKYKEQYDENLNYLKAQVKLCEKKGDYEGARAWSEIIRNYAASFKDVALGVKAL